MTKLNKLELVEKIRHSEGFTLSEKSKLIELINHNKRYGLIWEEKNENAEQELLDKLPILSEDETKAIINKEIGTIPNHVLIEGDNLHALTSLCFTHENKVDVIYIDPPYNTGNKDFKYNDSFVDKEDSYRHSKWLSFMNKRLRLAKRLLSPKGVIIISIGDDEQAQLKLLLDEIFYPQNFISNTIRQAVKGGTRSKSLIAQNHDYVLIYAKDKTQSVIKGRVVEGHTLNLSDEKGLYMKGRELNKWGAGSRREDSPTMWFPIKGPNGEDVYPIRNDGKEGRWRWGKKKLLKAVMDNEVIFEKRENGTYIAYEKIRDDGEREVAHSSLLIESIYSNANGTEDLKDIFNGITPFTYPKPNNLISHLLRLASSNDITILDFFAGSGTTLHSTMILNDDDEGTRKCILITNNENNICEEVTYERNKRVIQGYSNLKGEKIFGLTNNNLRYFKTMFVGRERTLKNKRQLVQLGADILRIKENCYTEIKGAKNIRIFNDDKLFLIVVSDDIVIPKAIEIIQQLPKKSIIKVYVFSEEQDPYTEDFYEVLKKIQLCALPDAIYKAYQNLLPKKKRTEADEEEINTSPNLSN